MDITLRGGKALKRILAILTVVQCVSVTVAGQTKPEAGLTVRSDPSGALVRLKGDATITGITPTMFRYPLVGSFDLTVKKYGYETYFTRVILDPSRSLTVDVSLKRKTRFKAAARSTFIPGWGQMYTEQRTKGFMFGFLTVAAVASYLIADNDFDHKLSRFESTRNRFDQLVSSGASQQDLRSALDDLKLAQDDAYDAETVRRITIGAIVGVWGLSVLDALILTPEENGGIAVKGLTFSPSAGPGGVRFTLARSF